MQTFFVKNNNSQKLYVVFLGWGMDEKPLLPLIKEENVLMFFDAKNLDFSFDFSPFEEIYVLGFSYGVMQAALLKDKIPHLKKIIALNGSLCMDSETLGLPQTSRQAMRGLTLENYLDFRKNWLVATDEEYVKFNQNAPWRTIEDCMEELDELEKIETQSIPNVKFDKILVAKGDKMIPTQNQLRAWQGQDVILIEGNHFALYQYESLSEIFA